MRFALSSDARSEFSTQFPILSAGRIVIEANWTSISPKNVLTMTLIRPDGSVTITTSGRSALRCEYRATQPEIDESGLGKVGKWTLKLLNNAATTRTDITGTLRITIPVELRVLEDTQFTLLGSGNAEEFAFNVPGPGRLEVDASWQDANQSAVLLTVSLLHPGEAKTYARRQGASPVNVDQQISEEALDRGSRWVVRLQNDTQSKITGRVKVSYTPSL